MQIKLRTLFLLLAIATVSCSETFEDPSRPKGTISVTVGSDPRIDIQSRTGLEPDGQTVRWVEGDQIALWAVDSKGSATLSAHPFRMYHYNEEFNAAKFTANITPMAEGTYDYYAASPLPSSTNGRIASFDLPAHQQVTAAISGEVAKLPYDIMVATPVLGADELTSGDNSRKINFEFKHKAHILKVSVGASSFNEPISTLALTFSQPVVGTLNVDTSNPLSAPTLSNGSNTLYLIFDQPVEPGTVAYAAIAPIDLSGELVEIVAYGQTGESQTRSFAGKNFSAGHITPITYNIPAWEREFTSLELALPADKGLSTLGEEVYNQITLTAPEGVLFDNGSNVCEYTLDSDGKVKMYFNPAWMEAFSEETIKVDYESDNTLVSNNVTFPALTAYQASSATLSVPYLYTEDFSGVNGEEFDDTKGNGDGWSIALDGTSDHKDLNLPRWSGQRIGSKANTAVRINSCHYRPGLSSTNNRYNGSLTSSPLAAIKSGATVNVKVTFLANRSSNNTLGYFGSTTATGHPTYSNSGQSSIATATKDSYDTIDTANEFPLSVTSAHRLWWNVSNNKSEGWGFSSSTSRHYLYIDNVKVSIVK